MEPKKGIYVGLTRYSATLPMWNIHLFTATTFQLDIFICHAEVYICYQTRADVIAVHTIVEAFHVSDFEKCQNFGGKVQGLRDRIK